MRDSSVPDVSPWAELALSTTPSDHHPSRPLETFSAEAADTYNTPLNTARKLPTQDAVYIRKKSP